MLKGKRNLQILIILNAIIWSYAGFKIYLAFNEAPVISMNEARSDEIKVIEDTSSYELSLNYDDPFLKKEPRKKMVRATTSKIQTKPTSGQNKAVQASSERKTEIKYLGIVSNKTSGITTVLVSFNGRSFLMKKGEIIEGAKLESISTENLILKIGREKVLISKS